MAGQLLHSLMDLKNFVLRTLVLDRYPSHVDEKELIYISRGGTGEFQLLNRCIFGVVKRMTKKDQKIIKVPLVLVVLYDKYN